jgi:hypothetical protein
MDDWMDNWMIELARLSIHPFIQPPIHPTFQSSILPSRFAPAGHFCYNPPVWSSRRSAPIGGRRVLPN